MIGPTGSVRVMVATKPVDFRKGAEGLAVLVRESMTADPFSGTVYVFRAKRLNGVRFSIRIMPVPVPRTDDRDADVAAATRNLQSVLELMVRDAPDQWMWIHRRWG